MTENSVRDIDNIRELESLKYQYQIRCSHFQLEFSSKEKKILCSICGKIWKFVEEKGFSHLIEIYKTEVD
ncbi:MAG TPA: hypothetical protein VN704_07665 [Verrucomicrobiae bacterium]|nr:hypothetical protein [Verrucomicrobiae bacterium]